MLSVKKKKKRNPITDQLSSARQMSQFNLKYNLQQRSYCTIFKWIESNNIGLQHHKQVSTMCRYN